VLPGSPSKALENLTELATHRRRQPEQTGLNPGASGPFRRSKLRPSCDRVGPARTRGERAISEHQPRTLMLRDPTCGGAMREKGTKFYGNNAVTDLAAFLNQAVKDLRRAWVVR